MDALHWLLAPLQVLVQDLAQDLQDSLGQSGKFTFGGLFRASHDMLKDGRLLCQHRQSDMTVPVQRRLAVTSAFLCI